MDSDKFILRLLYILVAGTLMLAGFLAGTFVLALFIPWIAEYIGDKAAAFLCMVLIVPVLWIPVGVSGFMKFITKKNRPHLKDIIPLKKVPHFGMKMPQCFKEIRLDTFHPYIDKEGKENPDILLSDSGKWLKAAGRYYPIDLICGYNPQKNELYAIDGTIIKPGKVSREWFFRNDLAELFEGMGNNRDKLPGNAAGVFKNLIDVDKEDLYKADLGKLRLAWESSLRGNHDPEKDIFTSVLGDHEIKKMATSIKKGSRRLADYINFGDYQNEYSICNGVRLLGRLAYPMNKQGIDFLFECLNDVDEPYFMPAFDELMKFPRDILEKNLEERAEKTYEEQDVLKMAGLMFLAKRLDYDIKYISKIKETAAGQEQFDFEKAAQAAGFAASVSGSGVEVAHDLLGSD